jgi:hypothetical protein
MAQCPYSKAVWDDLSNWLGFSFQPPPNLPYRRLKTWWHGLLQKAQLEAPQRQEHLQRLIYVAWNIWKERCHWVFDQKAQTVTQLQAIIKSDVQEWHIAWSSDPGIW